MPGGSAEGVDWEEVSAFQRHTADLIRRAHAARELTDEALDRVAHLRQAAIDTPAAAASSLLQRLGALENDLRDHHEALQGDPVRRRLDEPATPSILERLGWVVGGHWHTTHGPTRTHRQSVAAAESALGEVVATLDRLVGEDLAAIERELEAAGAPWTPGRRLVETPARGGGG